MDKIKNDAEVAQLASVDAVAHQIQINGIVANICTVYDMSAPQTDNYDVLSLLSAEEMDARDSEALEHFWEANKPWSSPVYRCKKCGDGGMCRDNTKVLTSYPPKYEYRCNKCGNVEYRYT